jgi:hypothetical protein
MIKVKICGITNKVSHPQKSEKREDATELLAKKRLYYFHCKAGSAGRHLIRGVFCKWLR